MQAPTLNRITQTAHGTSKAVDHSAKPDPIVYAPEDATFDSYQQRGSGKNDAGNALRIRGKSGLHQFGHLEESYVKAGDTIKRGQPIAKMGHTGYTIPAGAAGAHLHYWILQPDKTYIYPPLLYKETFIGDDMIKNQADAEAYMAFGFHRKPESKAKTDSLIGKPVMELIYSDIQSKEFLTHNHQTLVELPELKRVIKIKDKEIARLSALVGEAGKWNMLKTLLRELLGIK